QQSLVLISKLPYVTFFHSLLKILAPEYFEKQEPCLEAGKSLSGFSWVESVFVPVGLSRHLPIVECGFCQQPVMTSIAGRRPILDASSRCPLWARSSRHRCANGGGVCGVLGNNGGPLSCSCRSASRPATTNPGRLSWCSPHRASARCPLCSRPSTRLTSSGTRSSETSKKHLGHALLPPLNSMFQR
ncbi:unnamed protein product, partial [Tetraodon nigroviridis]